MKAIIVETPRPYCILNLADPARAHVPACQTDVAATWDQHKPVQMLDDYDLTDRLGYLETMGEFK